MHRVLVSGAAVALSLSLLACGPEAVSDAPSTPPAEQALAPASRAPEPARELRPRALPETPTSLSTRALSATAGPSLSVRQVAAADGTRVRYLLGMLSCGLFVVGEGEAVVQGGRFELPYDASALAGWGGPVELYLGIDQDGNGACDETDPLLEVSNVAPAPGLVVDASTGGPTYVSCWLFQR